MVKGIRARTKVAASLGEVHRWLLTRQGSIVEFDGSMLHVGLPIAAARAVVCTIWLVERAHPGKPLIAGRLRAVLDPRDGSVGLEFEGAASPVLVSHEAASSQDIRIAGARVSRDLVDLIALECEGASARLSA